MKLFIGPLKCIEKIEYEITKAKPLKWYSAIGISILFMIIYSFAMLPIQIPMLYMDASLINNIILTALEIILIFLVVNGIHSIFFKKTYLDPIRKNTGKDYLFIFLLTIALMFALNSLIYPFYNFIPEDPMMEEMWELIGQFPLYAFISVSIAAPIIEEVFFRGVIFKGLLQSSSPKVAIILSAIIFGVIHGNIHQFITASLLGMFIAYIYYKTDSIYLAIFIHFINNTLSNLLIWGDSLISQIIISSIYLVVAIMLILLVKKKYKFPTIPKRSFSKNTPSEYNIDLYR